MSARVDISEAGSALIAGTLLAIPMGDQALIVGRASERERLLAIPGAETAWIGPTAGDGGVLGSLLPPMPLRAQRLLERVCPGAVAIRLGDAHGPTVRRPEHPLWTALIPLREPLLAIPAPASALTTCTVVDGPALPAETRITVTGGRPLTVDVVGSVTASAIDTEAALQIYCICTGNTCRSPMLEGLLRQGLIEAGLSEIDVRSAGAFAAEGQPASAHSVSCLGARGVDGSHHRSQPLDDVDVTLVDRFYCMTGSHVQAVRAYDVPADRIFLADPAGVPDPYGGPLAAYDACAESLVGAVRSIISTL